MYNNYVDAAKIGIGIAIIFVVLELIFA